MSTGQRDREHMAEGQCTCARLGWPAGARVCIGSRAHLWCPVQFNGEFAETTQGSAFKAQVLLRLKREVGSRHSLAAGKSHSFGSSKGSSEGTYMLADGVQVRPGRGWGAWR